MARQTNRVLQTTKEEIDAINKDNKQLIDDFIQYYIASDHSPKSVVVTKNNLELFFCYVLKHLKNRHFAHIRRKDYIKFQSFLLENGLSPSRIRAIRSSISSLSTYIEYNIIEEIDPDYDEQEYELWKKWKNVINSIPAPKVEAVRKKSVFEDQDVQKLLDMLIEKKKFQHAAVLALAWASGARKAEIVQFKTSYFEDKNLQFGGSMWLTDGLIRCKGSGKLGKQMQRYVLVSKFKKYLDLWLEERERLGIDSEYLFVVKGENGWEQMKDTTLNSYARTFTSYLGETFYFHSMRHQFVTELIAQSIPNAVVVEIIGWSSDLCHIYNDKGGSAMIAKYFDNGEIVKHEQKTIADL